MRDIVMARRFGRGVVVGLLCAPRQPGFGVPVRSLAVQPRIDCGRQFRAAFAQTRVQSCDFFGGERSGFVHRCILVRVGGYAIGTRRR
jgi:hypothetical protein